MKKVRYCRLSQKLRHQWKKIHKQNVYQNNMYVWTPKLSRISPSTKRSHLSVMYCKCKDLANVPNK